MHGSTASPSGISPNDHPDLPNSGLSVWNLPSRFILSCGDGRAFLARTVARLIRGSLNFRLVEFQAWQGVSWRMADLCRDDPCSLALTLRLVRRHRGIKQAHAAELLKVTQPTVSRIERGELIPAGALRRRLLDLVSARIHPARDAALRRLVEGSANPVHLVCDLTHRLLAASAPRECEWRRTAGELRGRPLWRYASEAIRTAEARLPDLGWGERDGAHALTFVTGANGLDELPIVPGLQVWERILLSDGAPARLVTSPAKGRA
jgi:transcriptional regulator with XRE-family HTH domain